MIHIEAIASGETNSQAVALHAPAKINLFLEVLERRDDAFHEIETLMTAVSIYDTLTISSNNLGKIRLACRWTHGVSGRAASLGDLPPAKDNLVYKAVDLLRRSAGVEAGADIDLVKRIPSAAGLGGASSDAAAALVASNTLWNLNFSRSRLAKLAAQLGSDVVFFLYAGLHEAPAALCRGRGERIEPLRHFPRLPLVIVRPPEGLSTAEVYRRCRPASAPRSAAPLLEACRRGDMALVGRRLFNRLEEPAEQLSPWIKRVKSALNNLECLAAQMSGSGASCFGLCRSPRHARRVASRLRAMNLGAVFSATAGERRRRFEVSRL